DTWDQVGPLAEDTIFYKSGKSWYEVFQTPPQGKVYYILAHQYMAAKLNIWNGASTTPAVDTAIYWAEHSFFPIYTPSSSLPEAVQTKANNYAELLDDYNNGDIGPGHCE
ncbi:MAG: hypothetical protein LUO99_02550, partial [Methanomicrobiales archaeon]|nr:hypothetical protein [Methanomicrobiales archaeon]